MKPLVIAALASAMSGALAGTSTAALADDPRAVACVFGTGAAQVYSNGAFKSEPASPISFEIAEIDAGKQTAVHKSRNGEGPLRVVRAVNALHYLEVVSEGYLNITTVYDRDAATGKHPAVHSRHFGLLGEAIVAQYQGFCTAR